jgi:hypothetical protein
LVPVSFFKKIITHFSLRREDIPNRKQTTSTKQTTCSLLHSYYFPHDLILKTTQSHCQLQAWIRLYNNQSSSRHHPWFLGDKPIFIISYRLSVFIIACRTQAGSRRHLRPFHLLVLASLWTKFSSSFPDFPRCSPLMSSFALLFFFFPVCTTVHGANRPRLLRLQCKALSTVLGTNQVNALSSE